MSKSTPGPWHVDLDREFILGGDSVSVEALTPDRKMVVREVCTLLLDTDDHPDGEEWLEDAANARLIASAPDLIACCKAWVEYFDGLSRNDEPGDRLAEARNKFHGERVKMTRAAIARAEGRAP